MTIATKLLYNFGSRTCQTNSVYIYIYIILIFCLELKRGQDLRIGSQNKKRNQIIWKKKFGQVGEKTKGLGRENPFLGGPPGKKTDPESERG